jgi:hypothetical protein
MLFKNKFRELCAKGHRFDPIKRLKLFHGLVSRLTSSWVVDNVKWLCCLTELPGN